MIVIPNLRNIFDQYEQEENRLTHSLLHAISSDNKILTDFLKFTIGKSPFDRKDNVYIGTQGKYSDNININNLPSSKKISIPDALIHDREGKSCILIESKVTAPLYVKQLDAHLKQVKKYGVQEAILLIITTDRQKPERILKSMIRRKAQVYWKAWWEIYQWAEKCNNRAIVKEFRNYMELLESTIINRSSSWEGMMTKFSGIPFGKDEPYSYNRAKWCLNSLMEEIRNHKKLKNAYKITRTDGRPAITGSTLSSVWDIIPLAGDKGDVFTKNPHITIGINPDWTQVQITLPNSAKPVYWNALMRSGKQGIEDMLLATRKNFKKGNLSKITMSKIQIEILQRHYLSQRTEGIKDGELHFDIDCLTGKSRINLKVKNNQAWLDAFWSVLASRRKANIQLSLVVRYYYRDGSIVSKPVFVDEVVRALISLKPFYSKMTSTPH